jgi:hypothetical protein
MGGDRSATSQSILPWWTLPRNPRHRVAFLATKRRSHLGTRAVGCVKRHSTVAKVNGILRSASPTTSQPVFPRCDRILIQVDYQGN